MAGTNKTKYFKLTLTSNKLKGLRKHGLSLLSLFEFKVSLKYFVEFKFPKYLFAN